MQLVMFQSLARTWRKTNDVVGYIVAYAAGDIKFCNESGRVVVLHRIQYCIYIG